MDELPAGVVAPIARVMEMVVQDHEARMHPRRVRPRRTEPITVEPFADDRLDDSTLARGVELLQHHHYSEWQAAAELEVPLFLFQREVREYVRCLNDSLRGRLR